jgi:hypothetical protein
MEDEVRATINLERGVLLAPSSCVGPTKGGTIMEKKRTTVAATPI